MGMNARANPFQAGDTVEVCWDWGDHFRLALGSQHVVDGPYGDSHVYIANFGGGPWRNDRFKLVTKAKPAGVSTAQLPEDAFEVPADMPKLEAAVEANAKPLTQGDAVNLPSHYARFKIEPIRFLVENFGPVILVGKVVKYSMRYDAKNGLEDLRKAKRCLEMLIKHTEGDPDWWQRETK